MKGVFVVLLAVCVATALAQQSATGLTFTESTRTSRLGGSREGRACARETDSTVRECHGLALWTAWLAPPAPEGASEASLPLSANNTRALAGNKGGIAACTVSQGTLDLFILAVGDTYERASIVEVGTMSLGAAIGHGARPG